MKTIHVKRDGRPATTEELQAAVDGKPLPPIRKARGLVMQLHERIAELESELTVTNKLLADRDRLLKAIPSCVAHGDQCVPHAIEWVEQVKTLAKVVVGKS